MHGHLARAPDDDEARRWSKLLASAILLALKDARRGDAQAADWLDSPTAGLYAEHIGLPGDTWHEWRERTARWRL